MSVYRTIGPTLVCFTDCFRIKLESEDEIKIKIKFIWTIFQLNYNRRKHEIVFPSILNQLENGPNEFYFYFTN